MTTDIQATFEDHTSILILVQCQRLEDQRDESIQSVLRAVQKVRCDGINVKYVTEYSSRRNEWYQFQAHRALRGVITIGEFHEKSPISTLNRHCEIVDPYVNTVLSTRCMFVGKDAPEHESENPIRDKDCPSYINKMHCLFYKPGDCSRIEQDVLGFLASISSVLQATRIRLTHDSSSKNVDEKIMLMAPFEKRDLIGLDLESRSYKKRWTARNKKMIADICLQLGNVQEALAYYAEVMEILRSVGDQLWLGAVYEGQCAASVGHLQPPNKGFLIRNQSFPMRSRRNTPTLLNNPTLTHAGSCKSLPVAVDPIEAKQFGRDLLTLDEIVDKVREANTNYERFSLAICQQIELNLKLTRLLAVFERRLQASDFLQIALVLFCHLNDTSWKLGWFDTVSKLYRDLGCFRKEAFYTRIGAVYAAKIQDGFKPNNRLCYQLMVDCLKGYQMDILSPNPYEGRRWHPFSIPQPAVGWPVIQAALVKDAVATASRLPGGSKLAAHHCVFYLNFMFACMRPEESREIAKKLDEITMAIPDRPVTLGGFTHELLAEPLPEINLINYPLVCKVKPLQLDVEPVKWRCASAVVQPDGGTPFIWAPTKANKNSAKQPGIEGGGMFASKWVKGEVACVEMVLQNAVRDAIKVDGLKLITEGPFDCYKTGITIAACSDRQPTTVTAKIQGAPSGTGIVRILGYEFEALGIRSRCLFRDATWMHKNVPAPPDVKESHAKNFEFVINCVNELPLLEVTGELQDSEVIRIHAGERRNYKLKMHNKSSVPVEQMDITIEGSRKVTFEWNEEELKGQLPLAPNTTAVLHLTLTGSEEFVGLMANGVKGGSALPSPFNTPKRRFQSTPNTPHKNAMPDERNIITNQIHILYSGGAGMEENYARKVCLNTRLMVVPSIVISQWDVLLADSVDQCYLVLEIENKTPHDVDLKYQDGKSLVVEKKCKIPVLIPRCKPSGGSEELETLCRMHVAKHVHLKWSFCKDQDQQVSGFANLNGCKWSPSQVDTILSASVSCELFVQQRLHVTDDEISLMISVPLEIRVDAHNTSLCSLHKLLVTVNVYQDYQNGTTQVSNICFHGPQKVPIECVEAGSTVKVSFCLLFLHVGEYKIEVDCSTSSGDCARAVSSQVDLRSGDDHKSHVLWKTSSPIDITVKDIERDPLLSVPL